jgi:arylsulfatase A-like enzyme
MKTLKSLSKTVQPAGILLILLFVLLSVSCSQKPKAVTPPNIIVILADDLGYAEVGAYGQELIETPNIDDLASNGIRFTQHYSGAPVCAPARCVLLTGKHLGHAFVRGNHEWDERGDVWDFAKSSEDPNLEGQFPLPTGTVTAGSLLQQAGYTTGLVGKWGLGGPLSESVPNKLGFDFFYGYNCQRQAHTYFPLHLWKNEEKVPLNNKLVLPGSKLDEGADPMDPASYDKFWLTDFSPDFMIKESLDFIRSNADNPFFLYFATPIPHNPIQAPKEWIDHYVEKFGDEEPYLGDKGYFPHRYPHAAYAAQISYMDDQIGQMVSLLKEMGIYENTVILFTSDNGPTYTGGFDAAFFDSAKPFRSDRGWAKGSLREGGIRVPMIASWPGHIQPGTEDSHISAFWDILPTLCEIAGITSPEDTDGISMLPALTGNLQQEEHEYLYWEFKPRQQAVRLGLWKGYRGKIDESDLAVELYNLDEDPTESNNVAEQHPDIVNKIEEIMKTARTRPEVERFRFAKLGD